MMNDAAREELEAAPIGRLNRRGIDWAANEWPRCSLSDRPACGVHSLLRASSTLNPILSLLL